MTVTRWLLGLATVAGLVLLGLFLLRRRARRGVGALCWCGSNRTYADCHRTRELLSPLPFNEIVERVDRSRFRLEDQTCLFNGCLQKPIGSHAIAEATLRLIADKERCVLSLQPTLPAMPDVALKPQAISKATRFPGFCAAHDKELFAPIEDRTWQATREQCLLVAYRALCAELWKMRWKVRYLLPAMREMERGQGPDVQKRMKERCDIDEFGARAALALYEIEKETCEDLIHRRDFSSIEAYAVEFSTPLPIASHRVLLTKLETDHAARTIEIGLGSFSLLPLRDGGRFIVVWGGKEEPEIARTLTNVTDREVPPNLLEFALSYSEDTFLSPIWYDGLAASEQQAVYSILRSKPRSSGIGLADLPALPWSIRWRGRITT